MRQLSDNLISKYKNHLTGYTYASLEELVYEIARKHNMTHEEVKKEYGENIDYIKYDLEVKKAFDIIKK